MSEIDPMPLIQICSHAHTTHYFTHITKSFVKVIITVSVLVTRGRVTYHIASLSWITLVAHSKDNRGVGVTHKNNNEPKQAFRTLSKKFLWNFKIFNEFSIDWE